MLGIIIYIIIYIIGAIITGTITSIIVESSDQKNENDLIFLAVGIFFWPLMAFAMIVIGVISLIKLLGSWFMYKLNM